jgi:hypothetical protein
MGIKSMPIVTVTALFTGGIMVDSRAAPIVQRYGAYGLLGWGAGFGTLREIAPLLTALMINGRVGANKHRRARHHGRPPAGRRAAGAGHRPVGLLGRTALPGHRSHPIFIDDFFGRAGARGRRVRGPGLLGSNRRCSTAG